MSTSYAPRDPAETAPTTVADGDTTPPGASDRLRQLEILAFRLGLFDVAARAARLHAALALMTEQPADPSPPNR